MRKLCGSRIRESDLNFAEDHLHFQTRSVLGVHRRDMANETPADATTDTSNQMDVDSKAVDGAPAASEGSALDLAVAGESHWPFPTTPSFARVLTRFATLQTFVKTSS